jgi:lambda family phage portal protein
VNAPQKPSLLQRFAAWILRRGYAGGTVGRLLGARGASGNANAEISAEGATLRYRARQLLRDNPYAISGVEKLVTALVGHGVVAQPASGSKKLDEKIKENWEKWQKTADFDGKQTLSGLIATVLRAMISDGEGILLRQRIKGDVKLRGLEADHLDDSRYLYERIENGNRIYQGIEYDSRDQIAAYWLYPEHPGSLDPNRPYRAVSVRVPAEDVIHLFAPTRLGQARGVTWLHSAVSRLMHLENYDEAELVRARVQACFSVFVTNQNEGPLVANLSGTEAAQGADGRIGEKMRPGAIHYTAPGSDVKFAAPQSSGISAEHARGVLRAVAAGLHVTYEDLTGDLSQVNYSSLRAGRLSFHRFVTRLFWETIAPLVYDRVWQMFLEHAVAKGDLPARALNCPVIWTPPRYEAVDPQKDYEADLMAVRSGFVTWEDMVAARGEDPQAQMDRIQAINAEFDKRGIILDIDPRRRQRSGAPVDQVNPNAAPASPKPDLEPAPDQAAA